MIQHLDLFSGIGGFSLAGRMAYGEQWNTVAFCEIDKGCRAVLNKNFSNVPIYNDITKLNGGDIIRRFGHIDVITAGFPCQPFSNAGKREGQRDDRFLWPELRRVISEVQPARLLLENVSGLFTILEQQSLSELEITEIQLFSEDETYLQTDIIERVQRRVVAAIIEEIRSMGYVFPELPDRTPVLLCIPACAVNAPHRRDRVWIVAENTKRQRPRFGTPQEPQRFAQYRHSRTGNAIGADNESADSNTDGAGQQGGNKCKIRNAGFESALARTDTHANGIRQQQPQGNFGEIGRRVGNDAWNEHWLTVATRLCRVDARLSRRLDGRNRAGRLKMLGNAIVPQVAAEILSAMELVQG